MNKTKVLAVLGGISVLVALGLFAVAIDAPRLLHGVMLILVGAGAGAAALALGAARANHRRLSRSIVHLERQITRKIDKSTERVQRNRTEITALSALVRRVQEDVARSQIRLIDELTSKENRREDEMGHALTTAVVTEITAQDALTRSYSPTRPIPADPVAPSTVLSAVSTLAEQSCRRILTVAFGQQALWFAYALPGAEILVLDDREHTEALRHAAKYHSIDSMQVVRTRERSPELSHFYGTWLTPIDDLAEIDAVVLGECTPAEYPAPFILARYVSSPAFLILPPKADPQMVSSWVSSGVVEHTDSPHVLEFCGRAEGE